ncbi:hypothetical protein [Xenorhabdus sp. Sc-CR9]|uniref:hypothetical protein n=1 Tax=Xenorhabdus sp. Sc-CR9 TaxID=2584468 RepID=UPI001F3FC96B|nr:hypothetical protein [Xenorhabdus sp. Sc-CR9]
MIRKEIHVWGGTWECGEQSAIIGKNGVALQIVGQTTPTDRRRDPQPTGQGGTR